MASIPIEGLSIQVPDTLFVLDITNAIALFLPSNLTNHRIIWSTSNSNIGTVDINGSVTAISPGSFTLLARTDNLNDDSTDDNYSATIEITVLPRVIGMTFINAPTELYLGYTKKLDIEFAWVNRYITTGISPVTLSGIDALNAIGYNPVITYTTSNRNAITVDQSGNIAVVGISLRPQTIIATMNNYITLSVSVIINTKVRPNVSPVSISYYRIYVTPVYIGKRTQAYPIVEPADAIIDTLWTTDNPGIIHINPTTGLITGLATGTFNVKLEITDSNQDVYNTSLSGLECTNIAESIIFTPQSILGLQAGESITRTLSQLVSIFPSLNTYTLNLTSSRPSVVTITPVLNIVNNSNPNVTITGISNGTATITAKVVSLDLNNKATGKMTISVQTGPTSLTTNIPNTIFLGKSFQASITSLGNNNKPGYYSGVQWSSSDTSVAVVSSGGLIKSVGTGSATINIIAGGQAGTVTTSKSITVSENVDVISVDPCDIYVTPGETTSVSYTIFPSGLSATVSWASSDSTIASVNSSTGVITAGTIAGSCVITATIQEDTSIRATISVHVGIPITSINVELPVNTNSLILGETYQATVSIFPENAIADFIDWNPSETEVTSAITTGIIHVTDTGLIIPVTVGTNASFTVYAGNHYGTIVSTTVSGIQVISKIKNISLPGIFTRGKNKTIQLTPQIFPTYATNKTVTWSSSNQNSAIVNSSGLVTTNKGGISRITATTQDGTLLQATTIIQVNVNPFYIVKTFAGSTQGDTDAQGVTAKFNNPRCIAVDTSGNLYVGDSNNNSVRKIDLYANVTTIATDIMGVAGIAIDSFGNIYASSYTNHVIHKITFDTYETTIFAGQNEVSGTIDETGTNATFTNPQGMIIDSSDNIYVVDSGSSRIRMITSEAVVTTVAGSTPGYGNGTGTTAQFNEPSDISIDTSGNLYVTDKSNYVIRKITPGGVVSTLAGTPNISGYAEGQGASAKFSNMSGITLDIYNNIYVVDTDNHRIRKITIDGLVTTFSGSSTGFMNGALNTSLYYNLRAIRADIYENLYICDDHSVRSILLFETAPDEITNIFSSAVTGTDITFEWSGGTGATSYTYKLTGPGSYLNTIPTVDNGSLNNTVIFTNLTKNTSYTLNIRAFNPNGSIESTPFTLTTVNQNTASSIVTTYVGSTFGFVDGIVTNAKLNNVLSIAINSLGVIYTIERNVGYAVRKINIDRSVSLIAGSVDVSGQTTAGPGIDVKFNSLHSIAVDLYDNIYCSDNANDYIYKINKGTNAVSIYATVDAPYGMAFDASNNLYVISSTDKIKKIDTSGNITNFIDNTVNATMIAIDNTGTLYVASSIKVHKINSINEFVLIAGNNDTGYIDGIGTTAKFNAINSIVIDNIGYIYLSETENNTIRKISPQGIVTTLCLRNIGFMNGLLSQANFFNPCSIVVDALNNLYIADLYNYKIRKLNTITQSPGAIINVESLDIIDSEFTIRWSGGLQALNYTYTLNGTVVSSVIDNGTWSQTAKFTNLIGNTEYSVIITGSNIYGSISSQPISVHTLPSNILLNRPLALNADISGNLYIADTGNYKIIKIGRVSGTVLYSTVTTEVKAITTDQNGSVYYVNNGKIYTNGVENTLYTLTSLEENDWSLQIRDFYANFPSDAVDIDVFTQGIILNDIQGIYVYDANNIYVSNNTEGFIYNVSTSGYFNISFGYGPIYRETKKLTGIAYYNNTLYAACTDQTYIFRIYNNSSGPKFGDSTEGYSGDGGNAFEAQLNSPHGITTDSSGIIYFADTGNHCIRKVTMNIVYIYNPVLDENGDPTYDGSGNPVSSPQLDISGNHEFQESFIITTVAGTGTVSGFSGDGGPATSALLNSPHGVNIDYLGNIYIADTNNNKIRKVDTSGNIESVLGDFTIFNSNITNTTITVKWTSIIGPTITEYEYSVTQDGEPVLDFSVEDTGLENRTATITGLTANTEYEVTVTAVKAGSGTIGQPGYIESISWASLPILVTTVGSPSIPTNLVASFITTDGFTLTWTGANRATSYSYLYEDAPANPETVVVTSGKTAVFTGLSDNTAYDMKVRAINQYGETDSLQITVKTTILPPSAITNLTASVVEPFAFTLTWSGGDRVSTYNYNITPYIDEGRLGKTASFSGFNQSTTYIITLSGTNVSGVTPSASLAVTTISDPFPISAITDLQFNNITYTSFTVTTVGGIVPNNGYPVTYEYSSIILGQRRMITPENTNLLSGFAPGSIISLTVKAMSQYSSRTFTKSVQLQSINIASLYCYNNIIYAGTNSTNIIILNSQGIVQRSFINNLNSPRRVVPDSLGNLYVASTGINRIYKVDTSGNITLFAGTGGNFTSRPSIGTTSSRNIPIGSITSMTIDSEGNVYTCNIVSFMNVVYKFSRSSDTATVMYTNEGFTGDIRAVAIFNNFLYISRRLYDSESMSSIQRINLVDTNNSTTISISSSLTNTTEDLVNLGMVIDSSGNVYSGTYNNGTIYKITINYTTNTAIRTVYYTGPFTICLGMAIDSNNNIYISDNNNTGTNFRLIKINYRGDKHKILSIIPYHVYGPYPPTAITNVQFTVLANNAFEITWSGGIVSTSYTYSFIFTETGISYSNEIVNIEHDDLTVNVTDNGVLDNSIVFTGINTNFQYKLEIAANKASDYTRLVYNIEPTAFTNVVGISMSPYRVKISWNNFFATSYTYTIKQNNQTYNATVTNNAMTDKYIIFAGLLKNTAYVISITATNIYGSKTTTVNITTDDDLSPITDLIIGNLTFTSCSIVIVGGTIPMNINNDNTVTYEYSIVYAGQKRILTPINSNFFTGFVPGATVTLTVNAASAYNVQTSFSKSITMPNLNVTSLYYYDGLIYAGTNSTNIIILNSQGVVQGSFISNLNSPRRVVPDSLGNLYVASTGINRIYKVDTSGNITLFAGTGGNFTSQPSIGTTSSRNIPIGSISSISVDSSGNVYTSNAVGIINIIYKFSTTSDTATVMYTNQGLSENIRAVTTFNNVLYISRTPNNTQLMSSIQMINLDTNVSSRILISSSLTGATEDIINIGMVIDSSGNVYSAGYNNGTIYKITINYSSNTAIRTIYYTGPFTACLGMTIDNTNNIYITDNNSNTTNFRLIKISYELNMHKILNIIPSYIYGAYKPTDITNVEIIPLPSDRFMVKWSGGFISTSYTYAFDYDTPSNIGVYIENNGVTDNSIIISSLDIYTTRLLSIYAINEYGSASINYNIEPTTITNIVGVSLSPYSLQVSWISYFTTSYICVIKQGATIIQEKPADIFSRSITFYNLNKNTTYSITITASNRYGSKSSTISFTTDDDIRAITDLTISNLTATSFSVTPIGGTTPNLNNPVTYTYFTTYLNITRSIIPITSGSTKYLVGLSPNTNIVLTVNGESLYTNVSSSPKTITLPKLNETKTLFYNNNSLYIGTAYTYFININHQGVIQQPNYLNTLSNTDLIISDSSGNIYYASKTTNKIFKIDTSGNQTFFAGTGSVYTTPGVVGDESDNANTSLGLMIHMTIDSSNNIYVYSVNSNSYMNRVYRLTTSSPLKSRIILINNIYTNTPDGYAIFAGGVMNNILYAPIQAYGQIWITDVIRLNLTTLNVIDIISVPPNVPSVSENIQEYCTIDNSGNLYYPSTTQDIYRINTTTGNRTIYYSGLSTGIRGLAMDPNFNLYVSDNNTSGNNYRIVRINPGGSSTTVIDLFSSYISGDYPPTNITNVQTTIVPTGIRISWTGGALATSYSYSINKTVNNLVTTNNGLSEKNVIFGGLDTDTDYIITITASNATGSTSYIHKITPTEFTNVSIEHMTPFKFKIMWNISFVTEYTYSIKLNNQTYAATVTNNALSGKNIIFEDLIKNTSYSIIITAKNTNTVTSGSTSLILNVTSEDDISEITDLAFNNITSSSFSVTTVGGTTPNVNNPVSYTYSITYLGKTTSITPVNTNYLTGFSPGVTVTVNVVGQSLYSTTASFSKSVTLGSSYAYSLYYYNNYIYIVTNSTNIIKMNTQGVVQQVYPGNVNGPWRLAVDTSDNMYVAAGSYIYKVDPSGNKTTFAGNGGSFSSTSAVGTTSSRNIAIGGIIAMTIDSSNNIYTSNFNGSSYIIYKFSTGSDLATVYYTSGNALLAMAIYNDSLYISRNTSSGTMVNIDRVALTGGSPTTITVTSSIANVNENVYQGGMVIDSNGIIYTTGLDNGNIYKITISENTAVRTLYYTGVQNAVSGLMIDPYNVLYLTDGNTSTIGNNFRLVKIYSSNHLYVMNLYPNIISSGYAPTAITNVQRSILPNGFMLYWSGGIPAETYTYEFNSTTTGLSTSDRGITNGSVVFTGLNTNTAYRIKISGTNSTGSKNIFYYTLPSPFTNIVTANRLNSVTVSWNIMFATGYSYTISPSIVNTTGTPVVPTVTNNAVSGKNIIFSGLSENMAYNVTLTASNIYTPTYGPAVTTSFSIISLYKLNLGTLGFLDGSTPTSFRLLLSRDYQVNINEITYLYTVTSEGITRTTTTRLFQDNNTTTTYTITYGGITRTVTRAIEDKRMSFTRSLIGLAPSSTISLTIRASTEYDSVSETRNITTYTLRSTSLFYSNGFFYLGNQSLNYVKMSIGGVIQPVYQYDIFSPLYTVVDTTGNIYVASHHLMKIFKIDTSGNMSIFAGTGSQYNTLPAVGTQDASLSTHIGRTIGMTIDSSNIIYAFTSIGTSYIVYKFTTSSPSMSTVILTNAGTLLDILPGGVANNILYAGRKSSGQGINISRIDKVNLSSLDVTSVTVTTTISNSFDNGFVSTIDPFGNLYYAGLDKQDIYKIDTTTGVKTIYCSQLSPGITSILMTSDFYMYATDNLNIGACRFVRVPPGGGTNNYTIIPITQSPNWNFIN